MRNCFLFLIMLLLIVLSCRKDSDITITNTEYDPPSILVTGNLVGQIVDEEGFAMPNVVVRVGNYEITTNELGLYRLEEIQMNARGTYIEANLDGYFPASDRIYPRHASTNFSRIQLLSKTLAGTFDNLQGGTIDVLGAKVIFESNSLVNAQGELVNGEIQVFAKWLDPTADRLGDFMPGALFGVNTQNQAVTMTSMGMLAVELYDAAGNEVRMANDKEAVLQFPIPTSLRAIASNTIPLWYFDESQGLWIEEGSASLEGNNYIGKVKHFTFWNVDFPYGTETVNISGCVEFEDGTLATLRSFKVNVEGGGTIIWASTDNQGQFAGPIPLDETLVFELFDACGTIQEHTVGPFNEDTVLEDCFTINNVEFTTITGQLLDCDGEGINEGILVLQNSLPWDIFITDENGNFSYTFNNCTGQNITITAYDYANSLATEPLNYFIDGDTDLGIINVCDVLLEDLLISDADGLVREFLDLNLSIDSVNETPDGINYYDYSLISGSSIDDFGNQSTIELTLISIEEGSYTGDNAAYFYEYITASPGPSFSLNCSLPCSTVTINITNNEGPGGLLEGDFSGTSNGFDNMGIPTVNKPVSGTFRVKIPD